MKTILFFIPTLDSGGAERVLVHIMNNLDRERFAVHLALLRKRGAFLDDIRDDIAIHELNTDIAGAFLKAPVLMRRIDPDIVFSTICYMNIVVGFSRLLARLPKTLFVARESGMPSVRIRVVKSVWNADFLYRMAYRWIDCIVCQSNEMRDDVSERYNVPLRRIVTINNPVDVDAIRRAADGGTAGKFHPDNFNMVAVGRLYPVKGFDLLLRALGRTTNGRLHLHIIGAGEQDDALRALAADLDIAERVTFHGFRANPYPYMRAADLFVLSSVYEGFPNAVLEALSLGCPVLAFDCPGGTRELVEPGVNGMLVPPGKVDALAREMDRAVDYDLDRESIAARAGERFGIGRIMGLYQQLLERGRPSGEPAA
jgi:glycosyltransferase involved in cell wall biosynthesis